MVHGFSEESVDFSVLGFPRTVNKVLLVGELAGTCNSIFSIVIFVIYILCDINSIYLQNIYIICRRFLTYFFFQRISAQVLSMFSVEVETSML